MVSRFSEDRFNRLTLNTFCVKEKLRKIKGSCAMKLNDKAIEIIEELLRKRKCIEIHVENGKVVIVELDRKVKAKE